MGRCGSVVIVPFDAGNVGGLAHAFLGLRELRKPASPRDSSASLRAARRRAAREPFVFLPWLSYRVLGELLLKERRSIAPRDRARILAWSGLWPLAIVWQGVGQLGGHLAWTEAHVLAMSLAYHATWSVFALLTITLARTIGRIQRDERSREADEAIAQAAPCDVLLLFTPADCLWTQAACSLLEGRGVRCWIPSPSPAWSAAMDVDLHGALLVLSSQATADAATVAAMRGVIDADVPVIPIDIDGHAATAPAFSGVPMETLARREHRSSGASCGRARGRDAPDRTTSVECAACTRADAAACNSGPRRLVAAAPPRFPDPIGPAARRDRYCICGRPSRSDRRPGMVVFSGKSSPPVGERRCSSPAATRTAAG